MFKVYVCEDNEVQRLKMEGIIDDIKATNDFQFEKGIIAGKPEEILENIKDEKGQDLYFLDIDLGCEMNGLDLAKEIRKVQPRCYIVFVTTHSEMSFMTFSYRVEAMDFILKDNPDDLKNRVHQCVIQAISRRENDNVKPSKNISIKIGDHVKNVPLDQIKYFEAAGESRKLILHGNSSIIEFYGKLKDIEQQVDERFVRCHRAIIINKDYIERIDKDEHIIYLEDGESCPMSVRLGKNL